MVKRLLEFRKKSEFYIILVIVLLSLFIEFKSGLFFSNINLLDLLRAMIIPGMFALGTYLVIISGGFDVSFPMVGALSMYLTTLILEKSNFTGSIVLGFVLSVLIGTTLGIINGFLVMLLRIPSMIITLGTSSVYAGLLHGFLEAREICTLPSPMHDAAQKVLIRTYDKNLGLFGELPLVFLVFPCLAIVLAFIMKKTTFGRYVFAIGGDIASAERVGIPVKPMIVMIYTLAGCIAGLTGITRAILMDTCHPNTFNGMDLTVIAAVILGGARVSGGLGSITGTILGTTLFAIINNSLQLMGVPNYWQKLFLGALIIVGTGISTYQVLLKQTFSTKKRKITSAFNKKTIEKT